MAQLPLVPSQWLSPFVRALEDERAPVEQLLRAARLPPALLEPNDYLLAEPPLWEFVEIAAHAGAIEGLGFRTAQSYGLDALNGFGPAIDQCTSLSRMVALFAAESPISGYRLVAKGGCCWFARTGSPIRRGAWLVEQFVVTLMIQAFNDPLWSMSGGLRQIFKNTSCTTSSASLSSRKTRAATLQAG